MNTEKQPFAVHAAKFSLWAPIIAIIINFAGNLSGLPQVTTTIIAFVAFGLYIAGFILGIIALAGMRKHGKKGILVRGIIGVTFNFLIIASALMLIPALSAARKKARQIAAMKNAKPYTFTAPAEFVDYPLLKKDSPDILQAYIKGDPKDHLPDIFLIIEDLGGVIGKDDSSEIVKGIKGKKNVRLLSEKWKGHKISVFEIQESIGNVSTLTYNAQIPVLPTAIQIKIVGLASIKPELINTMQKALEGIDGASNWTPPGES